MTKKEEVNNEMKVTLLLSGFVRELKQDGDNEKLHCRYAEWIVQVFDIHNVIQQRELLISFHEFLQANTRELFDSEKMQLIDEFEKMLRNKSNYEQ